MIRKITGEQVLMRIHIGESDRWERRPLWAALLDLLRARGLAGATVIRAAAGFGAHSVLHTSHIERLSQDLPLVIEVVDTPEHVESVLPDIDRMMSGGLITMEKVRVIRYAPGTEGSDPPTPGGSV
jgi:PII-like signaling protein